MRDDDPAGKQEQVFVEVEGDRWFRRNRQALSGDPHSDDVVLRLLEIAGVHPSRVLEVGASNGHRLERLRTVFQCEVTAVEPSVEAIEDGRRRYPAIVFMRGVASKIAIEADSAFDLVIANFVLHWVDRKTLLRSVAEIDRMVADGGFVVIGDFFPPYPMRVRYHHLPEYDVWTYKQAYAEIFTASELYEEVAALTFDHATHEVRGGIPAGDRCRVTLLRKSYAAGYAHGPSEA